MFVCKNNERIILRFTISNSRDDPVRNRKMTEDYILFTLFWAIFLLTAKATERISEVFKSRKISQYNQKFARELIVKKELSKYSQT